MASDKSSWSLSLAGNSMEGLVAAGRYAVGVAGATGGCNIGNCLNHGSKICFITWAKDSLFSGSCIVIGALILSIVTSTVKIGSRVSADPFSCACASWARLAQAFGSLAAATLPAV